MPSYERWIRRAKQALKDKNEKLVETIKNNLSHTPALWERVLRELEEEKKPVKKAPAKKVKKAKKDE